MDDEIKKLKSDILYVRAENMATQSLLIAFFGILMERNDFDSEVISQAFDVAANAYTSASYDISDKGYAKHSTDCLEIVERLRSEFFRT
ncbi:MAG: hypothetical protein ABJN11_17285 [Lentilitoribacter sp.]